GGGGFDFVPGCGAIEADVANLNDVAGDFEAEITEKQASKSARSDAGGGFAGGRALEDVTGIVKIEFLGAGEVGMAGTRREELLLRSVVLGGFDRENFLPIGPVAIFDAQGNGGTNGSAVTDASEDVGTILFDFLAAAAAVAELA